MPTDIDIVIPFYNEKESLPALLEQIGQVGLRYDLSPRVIAVDDGSTDGSWEVLSGLNLVGVELRGLRTDRNYGKSAALALGFEHCAADIVLMMDADLQDDPEEIPRLLERLEAGFDLISGWKQVRYDPWSRKLASAAFNTLVNWATGLRLHDHNCGYKVMKLQTLQHLQLVRGMHRFVTVLVASNGGQVGEVPVRHRPRPFGRSKYGFARLFVGAYDLLRVLWWTRMGSRSADRQLQRRRRPVRVVAQLDRAAAPGPNERNSSD